MKALLIIVWGGDRPGCDPHIRNGDLICTKQFGKHELAPNVEPEDSIIAAARHALIRWKGRNRRERPRLFAADYGLAVHRHPNVGLEISERRPLPTP
jgi:hypothetical protein